MPRTILILASACVVAIALVAAKPQQVDPAKAPSVGVPSADPSVALEVVDNLSVDEVCGTYLATHKDWRIGFLTLRSGGEFMDERASRRGTWLVEGDTLVLKWDGYPESHLRGHEHGNVWCGVGEKFYMVKE
jgi:hypothetical protein